MPHMHSETGWFLERLRAISRAIAGLLDHNLVLNKFAQEMQKILPHDHLDIVLLHGAGRQVCYEAGISTSWTDGQKDQRPTATSPARDVLLGRVDWIVSEDAQNDRRFLFRLADNGPIFDANLRSRIIVPLTIQGRIIGSLALSSHKIGVYSEAMIDRVQTVGDILAPYLFAIEEGRRAKAAAVAQTEALGREEALRLGAQRLTEGMEQERQRLGMDIHDQTLADLARLVRHLNRARHQSPLKPNEFKMIEKDLEQSLNDLRGIVEDMKPSVLELFGFAEAVEAHLDRSLVGKRAKITTTVKDMADGAVDLLPDMIRTPLFRIVQEAITNAIKHAKANMIDVEMWRKEEMLMIRVQDNGTGIKTGALESTGGLDNIATRARLISAQLHITHRIDGGTMVELSIPMIAEAALSKEVGLSCR